MNEEQQSIFETLQMAKYQIEHLKNLLSIATNGTIVPALKTSDTVLKRIEDEIKVLTLKNI